MRHAGGKNDRRRSSLRHVPSCGPKGTRRQAGRYAGHGRSDRGLPLAAGYLATAIDRSDWIGGREKAAARTGADSGAGTRRREADCLTFDTAAEVERWFEKIQACQSKLNPDSPAEDRRHPGGRGPRPAAPEVPHVALGRVAFMHRSRGDGGPRDPASWPDYSGPMRLSIASARSARKWAGEPARSPASPCCA